MFKSDDQKRDLAEFVKLIDEVVGQPACTQDPELWFPSSEDGGNTLAARLCHACPIIAECLEFGVKWNEPGIWGGKGERARKRMRAARGLRTHILKAPRETIVTNPVTIP